MRFLKNKFINASLWYIVANFMGQGIVLFSNIIFTRIMPQYEFGLYSTYYSVVALLTPFVGANLFLGLKNGYFDFKDDRLSFRKCVFFLSFIVFFIFSIVLLITQKIIFPFFNIDFPFFITIMSLIHAYSFFAVNYYINYKNMENSFITKSLLMFLPNFLQVAFSILLIHSVSKNSYHERVLGSVFGVFACASFVAFAMLRQKGSLFNKNYYKYALKISVPSVLSSIAYMVMQQSDHVMVTAFIGAEVTAVYSLVYLIGNILYAFLQATNGVFQSWIYRTLDRNKDVNIYFVQKWYLFFFLILTAGLLMISPEVIKILSPESYWDFRYIPPFVAGSALLVINSMYSCVGEFYKKAGRLSASVLFAASSNIVLNLVFIKSFGAIAAAYTSFAAYLIMTLLNRKLVRKLNKSLFSDWLFVKYVFNVVLLCAVFLFINHLTLIRYMIYIFVLGCMSVYVYFQRYEVQKILKQ